MRSISLKSFLFLLPFVAFFLLNLFHLHDKYDLGDDFAQYIIHAQNIISGQGYTQNIRLDPDVIYPPGLPLILAPLIGIFGSYSVMLKAPNVLFYFGGILFLFLIFKKHMPSKTAYMICLLMASSSLFFFFKQHVLSDIPFFFWVCGSLYLAEKYCGDPASFRKKDYVPTIIFFSMAMLTRNIGAALWVAAVIFFLLKKDFRKFSLTLAGFLGLSVFLKALGVHSINYNIIAKDAGFYIRDMLTHIPIIFKSAVYTVYPNIPSLTRPSPMADMFWNTVSYAVYAIIFVYLASRLATKKITFTDIFLAVYGGVLMLWSVVPAGINEFNRYVWPLLGLFWIIIVHATEYLKHRLSQPMQDALGKIQPLNILITVLIVLNILFIRQTFYYNNYFQADPANLELVEWLKTQTDPDDHYIFLKPKLLAYTAQRIGTDWGYTELTETILMDKIRHFKITHIITIKELEQPKIIYFESRPDAFRLIWENKFYKIFHVITP